MPTPRESAKPGAQSIVSKADAEAAVRELAREVSENRKELKVAEVTVAEAKSAAKAARKRFKQARKAAKDLRKKSKKLKRAFREATLQAARAAAAAKKKVAKVVRKRVPVGAQKPQLTKSTQGNGVEQPNAESIGAKPDAPMQSSTADGTVGSTDSSHSPSVV